MMIAIGGISSVARSDSAPMLSGAIALANKANPSTVDKAKFPHYAAAQSSSNCAPYHGVKGASCVPWLFCGKSGVVDRLVRLVHEEEEVSTLRAIGSNQSEIRRTDFWPTIEQYGEGWE
jgi:hypothetical protein